MGMFDAFNNLVWEYLGGTKKKKSTSIVPTPKTKKKKPLPSLPKTTKKTPVALGTNQFLDETTGKVYNIREASPQDQQAQAFYNWVDYLKTNLMPQSKPMPTYAPPQIELGDSSDLYHFILNLMKYKAQLNAYNKAYQLQTQAYLQNKRLNEAQGLTAKDLLAEANALTSAEAPQGGMTTQDKIGLLKAVASASANSATPIDYTKILYQLFPELRPPNLWDTSKIDKSELQILKNLSKKF